MARNNNTRTFLSVRKNMHMDETCLSLRRKPYLSIRERDRERYIHIYILLDTESSPRFSSLIDRLVLLQNVNI